jgi:hypothetical protein
MYGNIYSKIKEEQMKVYNILMASLIIGMFFSKTAGAKKQIVPDIEALEKFASEVKIESDGTIIVDLPCNKPLNSSRLRAFKKFAKSVGIEE